MQTMQQIVHVLVGLAAVVALTACALPSSPSTLRDAPGPKRVDVTRSIETHFIEFAPGQAAVSEREREELLTFLREIDVGLRDPIAVLNDQRMSASIAQERRANVRALLKEHRFRSVSVGPREAAETSWAKSQAEDSVLVQVLHYRARTDCPDFSRPGMGGFENFTSSNFGCATAQNLGAMVAEPRDLVEGRELGPADGARMGQSIKRYRDDEVKTGEEDATAPTATTGGGQ